ncbi:MAG: hypothetical protein ACE14P_09795 [Methanotrichaceae archaeon]
MTLLLGGSYGQVVNAGGSTAGINQNVQGISGNVANGATDIVTSGAVGNSTGAAPDITNNLTNTGNNSQPQQISIYCVSTGCSEQKVPFGAGTLARGCYRTQSECQSALSQQQNLNNTGSSGQQNTANVSKNLTNTGSAGQQNATGTTGTTGAYYPVTYYPIEYYPVGYYYPGPYYPSTYYPIMTQTSLTATSNIGTTGTTGAAYSTGNITGAGTSTNVTPSIVVADQTITNNSILVAQVTVDTPGWVVIHNNLNGNPGGIIGFAPVNAGTSTNIQVPIDPKLATSALIAELHRDLGRQGSFEYPGPDVPVVGSNGMPVTAPFRVNFNLPGQVALGQVIGAIGTNGMAIQPIVIGYGVPSSNIGYPGVVPIGSVVTGTGPIATYTYPVGTTGNLGTAGTGVIGNTGTGTTISSNNGVTTVSGSGASTVSSDGSTVTSY